MIRTTTLNNNVGVVQNSESIDLLGDSRKYPYHTQPRSQGKSPGDEVVPHHGRLLGIPRSGGEGGGL